MKTTKLILVFAISAIMLLTAVQSALAMGKSGFDPNVLLVGHKVQGNKANGTVVVEYVTIDPSTPVNGTPCYESVSTDAPTQLRFFITLYKDKQQHVFSYESPVLCMLNDSDDQILEAENFLAELAQHVYGYTPADGGITAIYNFVDMIALVNSDLCIESYCPQEDAEGNCPVEEICTKYAKIVTGFDASTEKMIDVAFMLMDVEMKIDETPTTP